MTANIKLSLKGIDRGDALELTELLAENGAGDLGMDEAPNQVLAGRRHGAPELLDVALQLVPVVMPSVITALALWITRKKERSAMDYVELEVEVDGDKVKYRRFSGNVFQQASDPEAIKAILQAQLDQQ